MAGPQTWDEEVIFDDGDLYFTDLISGVEQARESIFLETYIFEQGVLASRIVNALTNALKRGCEVLVLVDGIGSPAFHHAIRPELERHGAKVRLFRVWPWQSPWSRILENLARLNRGTHRKFCLVDKCVAWIGSFNISDVHLRETSAGRAWMDLGVRVRGAPLELLVENFVNTFQNQRLAFPRRRRPSLLFLNSHTLIRRRTEHRATRLIKRARDRIWIQTPYFVPTASLYRSLIRAAARGVDVRLIVPDHHDVPFVKAMSYAFFSRLLKSGVRIFEFTQRFTHQKVMQIDRFCLIGSTNLNHRSFLHDLELDVQITKESNRRFLRDKFQQEQEMSRELSLRSLESQSLGSRFLSWILLSLRYWF